MAMTGGTDYLLNAGKTAKGYPVNLYLYVKTTQAATASNPVAKLSLGMYVYSQYRIEWDDIAGSHLNDSTFTKGAYSSGKQWLKEDVPVSVTYNSSGDATVSISWKWGVRPSVSYMKTWGKTTFTDASGKKYWKEISGTYQLRMPHITMYTSCIAPTSFTATPSVFDTNITLNWYGAKGGTNNSLTYYYIQYCLSDDNSTWGSWKTFISPSLSSEYSTYTKNMSDIVARGKYIKFRIRAEGSAGSSYYSGFVESSSVRRQPYTICTPPTSFVISENNFDTSINISWNGASGGTNNGLNGYEIQYSTSTNNSSWSNWNSFKNISTTKTSYKIAEDVSSIVSRGNYIKLRIRTKGSAGSSYYSSYVESNSIIRNLKSKCKPPTTLSLKAYSTLNPSDFSEYVFEDFIIAEWDNGVAGDNVTISGYIIEYQIASDDTFNWGNWTTYSTENSTYNATDIDISNLVNRGEYVRFRIITKASDTSYNSDALISSIMKRNTLPNIIYINPSDIQNTFSTGDNIELRWEKGFDNDTISPYISDIVLYRVYGRVSSGENSNNWSSWHTLTSTSSTNYTISNTSSFYKAINNEQYCEIRVVPLDMFCNTASILKPLLDNTTGTLIQRYDRSGVAIGIDGKYIDCQIYYGVNNKFVGCDIYAGINGAWVQCNESQS